MSRNRDARGQKVRNSFWNAGFNLKSEDDQLTRGNLGLGGRERRALARENSRPWGMSIFASSAVSNRASEAQRRGRSKAKGRKPVEKREGPTGMQRVTKKNKGWFD